MATQPDASADGSSAQERLPAGARKSRPDSGGKARAHARAVTFVAEIAFAQDWGRRQRQMGMRLRSIAGESPEAKPAAPRNDFDWKKTVTPATKAGRKTQRRCISLRML